MRAVITLAALLVVSLLAAPATAGEWSMDAWIKHESLWKGHGIGSSYTETTTSKMPGMPKMPNMPNIPNMPKGGTTVDTVTTTLTGITKAGYVLSVVSTVMGRKTTRTVVEPRVRTIKLDGQVKDAGEEAVTVEGKSYTCKVKAVANMEALMGDAKPKMRGTKSQLSKGKVWEHPKLGVLKMVTTMNAMGQKATMTWQVSRLSASHTIGKQAFTGREITMTVVHTMGKSTTTMLSSRTFAGGTLKNVTTSDMMGRKMTRSTVVTAYTKKPLAVTTGAGK